MSDSRSVLYLGFDINGREVEVLLGDQFESHVPSEDQVLWNCTSDTCPECPMTINVGDWITRVGVHVWPGAPPSTTQ